MAEACTGDEGRVSAVVRRARYPGRQGRGFRFSDRMPRRRRSPGVALEHTLSGRAAYQNEWKWDLRKRLSLGRNDLGSRSGRRAQGFNPAAGVHLGVGRTTEMPSGGATGSIQVPLDDRELLIS